MSTVNKQLKEVHVTRFELLMDAGFGAQKAGDILVQAFAHTGRFVYIEPMIPAEISPPPRSRPALSGVIIRVADFDVTNIGNSTDLIIASHEITLDRRLDDQEENKNCYVLLDMCDYDANKESYDQTIARVEKLGYRLHKFNVVPEAAAVIKSLAGKGKNIYYLGMLAAIYGMPEDVMIKEIRATFGKKLAEEIMQKNIDLFHHGHTYVVGNFDLAYKVNPRTVDPNKKKILIDGNTSLSMGIIDAGFKLMSGYPITPASSIMHTLAKVFPSYGGLVHQAEDEISAIGTAIGSYYGGVPAVTCSSGPGISLKQEFIGYASVAEIPIVIVDVQRSGPSTGMPTKTEQSDLFAAAFGSHGDNTKVVISVSNVIDCFYAPQLARYLTEKLRVPVFILSDFLTANSYKVIDKLQVNQMNDVNEIKDFVLERFHMRRLPDNIEMVRMKQSPPGTPGDMRRVTGLNTDNQGKVNYFSGTNHRSHAVRNEKIHHVRHALTKPEMFGPEEGDVLVVGWGSMRGTLEEAVLKMREKGQAVSGMHLRIVYPLPLMLKEIFKKFKKVCTVEVAYGDELKPAPLAYMLRAETLVDVKSLICKASGRPVQPRLIREKVQEVLNG